jgi:hypothetical protein
MSAISTRQRTPAPLSPTIDPERTSIAILTGSMARMRSGPECEWFDRAKLMLPYGKPAYFFDWRAVDGKDCLIYGFGLEERLEFLETLSLELMEYGADRVQWMAQFIIRDDGEAEMIDGNLYRFGSESSRLYLPKESRNDQINNNSHP